MSESAKRKKFSSPLRYEGNLFFLILFLIIWMPIGAMLLLKNGVIERDKSQYYIAYHGNWFWLFFWAVVFFPVMILLLIFKGIDIIEEDR